MKILINNYINLIKAFTSDGVKKLDSFDDLKQFCDEELDIFILVNLSLDVKVIIPHQLKILDF